MSRKLRPYQQAALDATLKQLEQWGSTVVVLPTGMGKCLAKGTPVLMFDGTIKPVEDIVVGDLLMGPDSTSRRVLSLARGREQLYRIKPKNGESYTVNESHILSLRMTKGATKGSGAKGGQYTAGTVVNIAVRDYLKKSKTFKHCAKSYRAAVEFAPKPVPMNPYLLGLWLGDGHSWSPTIYSADVEVHNSIKAIASSCGLRVTVSTKGTCPSLRVHSGAGNSDNPVLSAIRSLRMLNDKHVPHLYKANSREVRLELLAGLLDSDGTLTSDKTGYEFASTLETLANDVVYLTRSLGMRAVKSKRKTKCQNGTECDSYRVHIFGWCCEIPCRIYRKIAAPRTTKKDVLQYGFDIEAVGEGDYYGFEIDGDRLFLLGDFTVTHNTVFAAKLIAGWERGNTLFMAHTRELIHQAADKLGAELGYRPPIEMGVSAVEVDTIFQGEMCVVASVQTMYGDKRLEKYREHPFGLIVVDESHHSTAATYRKVIDFFRNLNPSLKVVGITATPNRADGAALGIVFESEAYQLSIGDSITAGWLVPIEQEYVVCESLNYDGIKTKKNEFGEADFGGAALEEVMKEEENLHAIARPLVEKSGDKPGLVFAAGVAHAHALAAVINRYKPDSAKAVDGTTDKAERARIVSDFTQGRLQFLANCQVFTEGFDAPNCSLIAMARPTKSLSLYMQMLGRGLRPLPGIVDGIPTDFDRRMAILTSGKPSCYVIDFVGNSNHKLANVFDVLGGNYDVPARELAKKEADRQRKPVSELLEQARSLLDLERLWSEREHITANADYRSFAVNPFGDDAAPGVATPSTGRGGCSDAQVGLLVKLGVQRETALAYSKRQAGAVIDKLAATRCTVGQARTLSRAGIDPTGIGMDRASRIIDALAKNNWQRPEVIPE